MVQETGEPSNFEILAGFVLYKISHKEYLRTVAYVPVLVVGVGVGVFLFVCNHSAHAKSSWHLFSA